MAATVSLSPRLGVILLITLIALLLRARAAFLLPVDADEPTYMSVATAYAADLRAGDLGAVIALDRTLEHPALAKLLYGIELAIAQPPDFDTGLRTARLLSAVFGALQVLLLSLLNPLAGFALAIHTMAIKYTSQVYLEATAGFFAIAAIVAFQRWLAPQPGRSGIVPDEATSGTMRGLRTRDPQTPRVSQTLRVWGWFILSAMCLGATAASKYPYLVVGLAIALFLPWREGNWRVIGAYAAIALASFFVLDISLWTDPLGRLARSLLFHPAFSQGSQVTSYGYAWWKPLDYLLHAVPWHPGVFYVGLDGWIFVLGVLGLPLLWLRSRPYVAWALLGVAVILLWPTKWPQYTLIVVPALCLSLGYGVAGLWHWVDERYSLGYYLAPFRAPRSTIILTALVGLALAIILFLEGFLRWQEALGWQQINMHNSGLPSDQVQALATDARGVQWIGTHNGLAAYDSQTWVVYTAEDKVLPSDSVQALAIAAGGTVWVGTDAGLASFSDGRWRQFRAGESGNGPAGDDVRGLAVAADGRLWVASTRGLSVFDGTSWQSYTAGASTLLGDLVYTVAAAGDGRIWAGTNRGAAVFDPHDGTWQRFDRTNSGLEWDAVSTIAVAPDGRVWLGTLGGGVTIYDGQNWKTLTTANSGLPWNIILAVAAGARGDVWIAADLPNQAGGNVARFDGERWRTFTVQRSGIATGGATCIAFDSAGRVIIGMRSTGLSLYTPR